MVPCGGDTAKEITQPGLLISLSLPFYSPFANNPFTFQKYNEHASENACINSVCECMCVCGRRADAEVT